MSAHDGAVGPQGCSFLDKCPTVERCVKPARGMGDIGEDARRAAEYLVFQFHPFVDGHIVLDSHPVAYPYIASYVDVLPERAVPAYDGAFLDVAEMPYPGACSYFSTFVDVALIRGQNTLSPYHLPVKKSAMPDITISCI